MGIFKQVFAIAMCLLHVLDVCAAFQITAQSTLSSRAISLRLSNNNNNNNNSKNLVGSISSSDGEVQVNQRRPTGNLGVSKKPRKKPAQDGKSQRPLSKKDRQRTGNGQVDSTKQTLIADPENENIQVVEAKRGNKVVTIVR
jgi:hypothetical protein